MDISVDARWHLEARGYDPATELMIESVFALVNGYSGTRAALEEGDDVSYPALYVAGIFNTPAAPQADELQDPIPELVRAPDWSRIRIVAEGQELQIGHVELLEQRRVLDMQRGVLLRAWRVRDAAGRVTRLRSLRFASLDNRHVFGQQLALTPENYSGTIMLEASVNGNVRNENKTQHLALVGAHTIAGGVALTMRTLQSGYVLSFVTNATLSGANMTSVAPFVEEARVGQRWTWQAEQGQTYTLDKRVVVYTSRDVDDPLAAASDQLATLGSTVELLAAHEAAWAARWQASDAVITGSEERQQQARWAIYQLIGAANPDDEQASIGARSITGERYRGHIFWDNETFVWPFYPYTDPQAARALLMYRYHRLDGARRKAQALGYRGALFPWESTDTGEETTPPFINVPGRGVQPVLTGSEEHHLAADIAYAVAQYRQATGDERFFLDYGAEMLLEIARFWASRVEKDEHGRYHILKVIGPDEYHESVDDNAYTNMMAQWTLRCGLEAADELRASFPERWQALAARLGIEQRELDTWQAVADNIVTGFDPATRLFEQFDGYYKLREVDLTGHSTAEKTMDIKLGWEEIQRTQVIKQSDVVMLLFLLWEQFTPDVREKNFRFYEPRTAHDSSLSPSFHALVAARLGDLPMAERYLHQAATIDLDFTRKGWAGAAGGVHIAAIGGIWQALAFGFLGMEPTDEGVRFRPHIPAHWGALQMMIQWRGSQLRVTAQASGATEIGVEAGNAATLAVGDGAWQTVAAGATLSG
ncbi:MAG TPA: glycosyl hydrolase family 65 protein [Roseiflexaceae bacterium]|nr:glycosyl hydrolase family 65 protein [Roseiflexaceae bacterium]